MTVKITEKKFFLKIKNNFENLCNNIKLPDVDVF